MTLNELKIFGNQIKVSQKAIMMKVRYSEIYELDPAHFLSGPGLVQQVVSKKKKVKLDLLTDFDILLMIQKGIGRGYASLFIDMQKLPVNDFK